jgi:hypothetical protein
MNKLLDQANLAYLKKQAKDVSIETAIPKRSPGFVNHCQRPRAGAQARNGARITLRRPSPGCRAPMRLADRNFARQDNDEARWQVG